MFKISMNSISSHQTKLAAVVIAAAMVSAVVVSLAASPSILLLQPSYAWVDPDPSPRSQKAPIAVSGDNNVYVVWFTDKTPSKDGEVMFKASTDGGKTFGNKTNLSNTPGVDSINAEINAAGNNVYVTWWERANATNNQPVMRVSNDNGKSFGPMIMLSEK
jgi:hypothetical protein